MFTDLCEIPKLRLHGAVHPLHGVVLMDIDNFMITNHDILCIWHTEVCLTSVDNNICTVSSQRPSFGSATSDAN